MRKQLLCTGILIVLLALVLTGCGRRERSFQGTITDITDGTVTIAPDPGAEILEEAESVCFDTAELEDLQAKAGDSVYVTYNKVKTSKKEGTTIRVISWQMMIRAPENDPNAAVIWQSGSEITVEGEDGLFLVNAVQNAPWQNEQMPLEPYFGIRVNGVSYGLDLHLYDCVWSCVLLDDTRCATITGGDALRIAGIYQANGLPVENWQEVDAAAGTKKVTTGLNLRDLPGTTGTVMTTVPAGTELTVTGQTDGWYQVVYEDMTLYGSADYLE